MLYVYVGFRLCCLCGWICLCWTDTVQSCCALNQGLLASQKCRLASYDEIGHNVNEIARAVTMMLYFSQGLGSPVVDDNLLSSAQPDCLEADYCCLA